MGDQLRVYCFEPDGAECSRRSADAPANQVWLPKTCALLEIYRLAVCNAELIVAHRDRLPGLVECDRLLDLLASGLTSGACGYKDYLAGYFASPQPPAAQPPPVARPTLGQQLPQSLGIGRR